MADMKRVKHILSIGFVCVCTFVLTNCGPGKPKDGRTDTFNSGVIAIAADQSFEPIIQEEIDVFESLTPLAGIVPRYVTEVEAVNLLLKDSLRLAVTSRRLTPDEWQSFHSRKFEPREIKIATDGLALITNLNNPDTLITVNDLRRILTGEVRSWKDIYSKSKLDDVVVVFDNKNSSTVRFAIDSICKGADLFTGQIKALQTNQEVINYVTKTENAIGVVGVNWLSNKSDSTGLSFNKEVHVMSVSEAMEATALNSFKPYQYYLFSKQYPLARSIYALLNDPRNGLSWGFSSFLTSDRGQRIILKSGLLPATQPVRVVDVKDE